MNTFSTYLNLFAHARYGRALALSAACVIAAPAQAADQAYQDFFSSACPSAPGGSNLENVCLAAATGISGDSESSLNPSQSLSSNDGPLARAQEKTREARDRAEESRNEDKRATAVQLGPFSLLAHGRGAWFERDAGANERGYEGDAFGLELGLDRRLSDQTLVGGFLAYERSKTKFDTVAATSFAPPGNAGDTKANSFSAVVFGAYTPSENFYLEGALGFGISDHTFRRNAVAQDSNSTFTIPVMAEGDTDGREYWASVGAGYDIYRGKASLGPYLRVTYARSEVDAYTEKDVNASGFAMNIGKAERTSLTTSLGVQASQSISYTWGVLVPQLRVEYEHEFKNDPQAVNAAFVAVPGVIFPLLGDDPDRNYFNLATGLQFILPNGLMPFVELEALLGHRDMDRYRLLLGLRAEL